MNTFKKNNDEFNVLRKINLNPKTKQRDLAIQLGFSLGKLNYCIRALKKKVLSKLKILKKTKINLIMFIF